MKKSLKKYLMILLLLGAGGMIYLYAHQGYFIGGNENNDPADEQADDIGTSTNDNPWEEMNKLVHAYYNKQGVSYKGSIKLIDDNGSEEKIIEQHTFEYSIVGQNMYYRVGHMEVVSKTGLSLVADNINQFVSVSLQSSAGNKNTKLFDIDKFKEMMEKTKAEAKVTQLGNQKILTIENIDDPQIQGYRIYYDPGTYQVSKMLIGMLRLSPLNEDDEGIDKIPEADNNTKNTQSNLDQTIEDEIETYTYYVEITYGELKILSISEEAFHPESKFITIAKNRIELTPAFSKYELLDNGAAENETKEIREKQE
jgi:hypothetical protein